jgi:hypothetical protein
VSGLRRENIILGAVCELGLRREIMGRDFVISGAPATWLLGLRILGAGFSAAQSDERGDSRGCGVISGAPATWLLMRQRDIWLGSLPGQLGAAT